MKYVTALVLLMLFLSVLTACAPSAPADTVPAGSSAIPDTQPSSPVQSSFHEVTVVDNEECMIKITGIEPDNLWSYSLKVMLENRSENQNQIFSVTSASVNGVQADSMFAAEVAPGKKALDEISFSEDFSDGMDIGDYTDIFLSFRVYDADDWSADPVAEPGIHIYPQGQENAQTYTRPSQPADLVLADNESVTVIVTGYREDALWGYTADVFLVNKTDTPVMFSVDDASVNGFMAQPYYAEQLTPGTCAFSSISWADTVLEDLDISQVESLEFTLRAYDSGNLLGEDLLNLPVTLTP